MKFREIRAGRIILIGCCFMVGSIFGGIVATIAIATLSQRIVEIDRGIFFDRDADRVLAMYLGIDDEYVIEALEALIEEADAISYPEQAYYAPTHSHLQISMRVRLSDLYRRHGEAAKADELIQEAFDFARDTELVQYSPIDSVTDLVQLIREFDTDRKP